MKTILRLACMYCGKETGVRDGQGTYGTSHGICIDCWEARLPGRPYPVTLETLEFGVNLALERREKLARLLTPVESGSWGLS